MKQYKITYRLFIDKNPTLGYYLTKATNRDNAVNNFVQNTESEYNSILKIEKV